jgi:putative flippase GtrA
MKKLKTIWTRFKSTHPGLAQFLMFFILSNGVTVLQIILMPVLKSLFDGTDLVHIAWQVFPVGHNPDGSIYYIFNYAAGAVGQDGTGGGLAYFLAVEITLLVAQVINFFAQRNITFKAKNSVAKAACWYLAAYIAITLIAGALQGLYKAPIYAWLMGSFGGFGQTLADVITMIINSAISFWVFFPIFKLIFRSREEEGSQPSAKNDIIDG